MAEQSQQSSMPVAYVIAHQPQEGQSHESYLRTIRELHRRVEEEAAQSGESGRKNVADLVAREAQGSYGALSQFLVTPLRTDQMEVKKILADAFGRVAAMSRSGNNTLFRGSQLSRTIAVKSKAAELTHMQKAAGEYLKSLGFRSERGEVFESAFIVEGGAGLDLLEHIVRDRLGIYTSPHGRHIEEAGAWTFAAYNIVNDERTQDASPEVLVELPLTKPSSLKYDEYRASLISLLDEIKGLHGTVGTAFWQRKLGLGPGGEFLMRVHCSHVDDVETLAIHVFAVLQRLFSKSSPAVSLVVNEILSV